MQYREHLNIGKYARQSFAVFLQQNKILKRLAEQSGLSPMDHVASLFGADTFDEEEYEHRVIRQVRGALALHLQVDNAVGLNGKSTGAHSARYITQVEFSPADAEFILKAFGTRADVKELWRDARELLQRDEEEAA